MRNLTSVLFLLCCAACSAPSLDLAAHYGQYALDGDIGFTTGLGGAAVTATSSLDSIGLGEDSNSMGAGAILSLGSPTLVINAVQTDYSGSGTLEADMSMDGFDFQTGAAVVSNLDLGVYQALLLFEVIPGDTVDLSFGLGVDALDLAGDFTAVDSNTGFVETASFDEMLPVPILAGRAAVALGPVDLSALVGWIGIDVQDSTVEMLDIDVRAGIEVLGPLTVFGGLRSTSLDVEYTDGADAGKLNLDWGGPYLGIGASF